VLRDFAAILVTMRTKRLRNRARQLAGGELCAHAWATTADRARRRL